MERISQHSADLEFTMMTYPRKKYSGTHNRKTVVASGFLHLLQVRASDWTGGRDEDMDRPSELPGGSIVDRDDIITIQLYLDRPHTRQSVLLLSV